MVRKDGLSPENPEMLSGWLPESDNVQLQNPSSVFPAENITFRFSPATSRRSNNGWGPAIAPRAVGGAENAGLKSRAVPVPRTANETIRSLTVSSMPLNLTVNTEPFLSDLWMMQEENWPWNSQSEQDTWCPNHDCNLASHDHG